MKKAVIGFLLMMMCVVLISTTIFKDFKVLNTDIQYNQEKLDIYGHIHENDQATRLMGNHIQNPAVRYARDNNSINSWRTYILEGETTLIPDDGTRQDRHHVLVTGGPNVTYVVPSQVTQAGEFYMWNNSAGVTENGGFSNTSYQMISQSLILEGNAMYELSVQVSSTTADGNKVGLVASAGTGPLANIIERNEFINKSLTATTLTLKFKAPANGIVTVSVRNFLQVNTNGSRLFIRNVGLKLDFIPESNRLIAPYFTNEEYRTLKPYSDYALLHADMNKMSTFFRNSAYGYYGVTPKPADYDQVFAPLDTVIGHSAVVAQDASTIETSINNLYENKATRTPKSTVTQQQITSIRSDIDSKDTNYTAVRKTLNTEIKSDLLNRVTALENDIQFNNQRNARIAEMETAKNDYVNSLRDLPQMDQDKLRELEEAANLYLQQSIAEMRQQVTNETVSNVLNTNNAYYTNAALQNAKDAYILDGQIKRDNLLGEIRANDLLTAEEKATYETSINNNYQTYETSINNATSKSSMEEASNDYQTVNDTTLSNANDSTNTNLATNRQNAISSLQTYHDQTTVPNINGLDNISVNTKNRFVAEANQVLESAKTRIESATTNSDIDLIVSEERVLLLGRYEAAALARLRNMAKSSITSKDSSANQILNGYTYLTETQKNAFVQQLLDAKDTSTTSIDASTTEASINSADTTYDASRNVVLLAAKRQNGKNHLTHKKTEIDALIDSYTLAPESDRTLAKDRNDTHVSAGQTELDTASFNEIDVIETTKIRLMEESMQLAKNKHETKQALITLVGENPSDELQQKLQAGLDKIDSSTSVSIVETESSSATTEVINQKRDDAKEQVEAQINAYVPLPHSQAITNIINNNQNAINNALTAEEVAEVVERIKKEILDALIRTGVNNLEIFIPTPRSNSIDQNIAIMQSEIRNATTPAEVQRLVEQSRAILLEFRRNEVRNELIVDIPTPVTQDMQNLINNLNTRLDVATTSALIDSTYNELKVQILEKMKEEAKAELLETAGLNPSSELQAILTEANAAIDSGISNMMITEELDMYRVRVMEIVELETATKELQATYNDQITSHSFTTAQTSELQNLYNNLDAQVKAGTISILQAKNRIIERSKDLSNIVYNISNGDFRVFDDNLSYGSNSGSMVYAGIANTQGIRFGTTMNISRTGILSDVQDRLQNKFRTGTLSLPRDMELTATEITSKLQNMQYIRQLDISLSYADGSPLTEFFGTYQVSILIPEEYRNYAEFLVVFETANGAEIFKTYRTNNWLTFETPHFSTFYVLGEDTTPAENLSLPLLTVLILASVGFVLLVTIAIIKISKMNQMKKARSLAIVPLLSLTGSIEIILIIILSISLLILIIYLIKLIFGKNKKTYFEENHKQGHKDERIVKERVVEKVYIVKEPEKKVKKEEVKSLHEEEDDDDEESDTEILYDEVTGIKTIIRHNYSLLARLYQASEESQSRFSELKNLLLSFEDVKVRSSWRYDRFSYKGETILKIAVYTKTVKIFFAENPRKLLDREFNLEDVSNKKVHENTPYLMRVDGPKLQDYALRIVSKLLNKAKLKDGFKQVNYKFPYKDRSQLIKMDLVKLVKTEQKVSK